MSYGEYRGECKVKPPTDPFTTSKVNPDYLFVRKDLKDKLSSKYQKLFEVFDLKETAVVHKNSATAKMIEDLTKLSEGKKVPDSVSTLNAFNNTDYMREDYILEKLIKHIKSNFDEGSENQAKSYFCSMFTILQSSGYGKSKLMERLGSRIPTFYSSMQQGSGYPQVSFFLMKLVEKLDAIITAAGFGIEKKGLYMNNVSTATYVYILRIFYLILKKKKNQKLDRFLNIDAELIDVNIFPMLSSLNVNEQKVHVFDHLFKGLEEICCFPHNIVFDGETTITLDNLKFGSPQTPVVVTQAFYPNKFSIESKDIEASSTKDTDPFTTDNLENEVMLLLESFKSSKDLPSVFIIDEAHGLLYKSLRTPKPPYEWKMRDINLGDVLESEEVTITRAPYNVFRRVYRIFTNNWKKMMLITISTCGQISVLLPELKNDPSRRPKLSDKLMENFSFIQTYNVNSVFAQKIESEMFKKEKYHAIGDNPITDWNVFLDSKFRKIEYFKFGRPLTYAFFKEIGEQKVLANEYNLEARFFESLEFKFMAMKLFGGSDMVDVETNNLSCLYSMFNFAFGTNHLPPYIDKKDLIENYMMTLVKYLVEYETEIVKQKQQSDEQKKENEDKESSHIIAGFMPEGVLNFLSARYFVQYPKSLSTILMTSVRYGLCDRGGYGELLAQFFLLSAIFLYIDSDLDRVRKLVFQPVLLTDFLTKLSGQKIDCSFLGSDPLLEHARLSFGYFEHFPINSIEKPFNLMARCLFKGSALTLHGSFPGIDLMIPLVLGNGQISFLGVQVKYVNQQYMTDQIRKAVPKMTYSNIFGGQSTRPFAMIILALKEGSPVFVEKSSSKKRNPLDNPDVIVFKGISDLFNSGSNGFV